MEATKDIHKVDADPSSQSECSGSSIPKLKMTPSYTKKKCGMFKACHTRMLSVLTASRCPWSDRLRRPEVRSATRRSSISRTSCCGCLASLGREELQRGCEMEADDAHV